ncbi:MAG TPA: Nif3-like dinuclear metal center hexameric protein [Bryobacteraceae bacterium]|jgi:putative NIF3 family GTP cyclohydrolase 1 type 2
MPDSISRRAAIGAGLAAAAVSTIRAQEGTLTAGAVIDRIKSHVGVPWREQTVDKIIAGAADTRVAGIATTMMATQHVLNKAAAAGLNMVITHESTFFSHQDTVDQLKDDPTYRFKLDFITKNNMVVFHFHDHWHAHKPADGIATGMARALGWEKAADPQNPRLFSFEHPKTLAEFAKLMETKLGARTIRVLGDPRLPVKRAIASWGFAGEFPGIPLFARPDIDVLIVGETREWELVEYVQDTIDSGQKKALIVLGHVVSEQAGMQYCAEWLAPLVTEVPVHFVAAVEPFWSPEHPFVS